MLIVFAAIAALLGCGGALDRHDGALVIALTPVPAEVDTVDVVVQAAGRSFSTHVPRPADSMIREFTAVPVGPALVDVRLMVGPALYATRLGMTVAIVENETASLTARFADGPEVVFESPAERAPHRLQNGPLLVQVRAADPLLDVVLTLVANGREVPVRASGGRWSAEIDPLVAGPVFPASLKLEAKACLESLPLLCRTQRRAIEIHRRMWSVELESPALARPVVVGDDIVLADLDGQVRVRAFDDGREQSASLRLESPVDVDLVVAGPLVLVAERRGILTAWSFADGSIRWQADLQSERPTAPVVDGARALVGAGMHLLAVDLGSGQLTRLVTFEHPLRAAPMVDTAGIVAVDLSGHVVALRLDDSTRYTADVDAEVIAAPIRHGVQTWVATVLGQIHRFGPNGEPGATVDVGGAVAFAPVVLESAVAVAAGQSVVFIEGDSVRRQPAGAVITGGIHAWQRGVIVGTQSGAVQLVTATERKLLTAITGAAISVTPAGADVLVTGAGELSRLGAEEGF